MWQLDIVGGEARNVQSLSRSLCKLIDDGSDEVGAEAVGVGQGERTEGGFPALHDGAFDQFGRRAAGRIAAQDQQITGQAGQIAELMEANEVLVGRLARLEHLLSRNSGNSSNPPSKDDDPGKPAPPEKRRGPGGPAGSRGKQHGSPGTHLAWTDTPNAQRDRFPEGRCECGHDLAAARDLGVVDRYQQHEIPQVAVTVT